MKNCRNIPEEAVKETPGVNFNPDTKQYSYENPDRAKLA